jgi:eukaryotic-like serine/threonine-protein kinase
MDERGSAVPTAQVMVFDARGQRVNTIVLTSASLTIGRRPDNDLVLENATVGRNHVRIDWDDRQVLITDLGSPNGTLLGDVRLAPQNPHLWMPGQVVQIGPYSLQLQTTTPGVVLP